MHHVANLIHLLSLNLGLIAIILAITLRKRSGYSYLVDYNRFLITFNVVILLVHFMETILRAILTDEVYEANLHDFYVYMIVFLGCFRMYMAWSFLKFAHRVLGKEPPYWSLYVLVVFPLLVVLGHFFLPEGETVLMWANFLSIFGFHLIVAISLIASSLWLLRKREEIRGLKPGMIRPAFLTIILFASAELLLRTGNFFDMLIPVYVIMLGVGAVSTAFNLLHILYLRKVVALPRLDIQFSPGQLYSKYGITEREKEIIHLICEGRTNKEIGEILFISPITVRDHLSNIYRKTGVRGRTQLAGLFIERPAG
jgi:DNA-binding CsgD family transcriptional regulator